jgi:ubiquinone/menaquinone biosynthesis C-methylase UbiE
VSSELEPKENMKTVDETRDHIHRMWSAVAPAWADHAAYVDDRSHAEAIQMLRLTDPRPGERVLELACGAGGVGLAAAELVGPDGEVVLSDVAVEMTAIASARVATRGLDQVTTRVLDMEQLAEPECSYDVVLCRDSLMFVPDPGRAVREIYRVLRPGGRFAVTVWGSRARNPWLGVVFDVVAAQMDAPMPPPGVPGPFSLGDAVKLAGLFRDAALNDVCVTEISVPLRDDSFDDWWQRTTALAGPLSMILASQTEAFNAALRTRAREAVRPYQTGRALEFPGVALLASGRRV